MWFSWLIPLVKIAFFVFVFLGVRYFGLLDEREDEMDDDVTVL